MASSDYSDLLNLAREKFHLGDYQSAEPLLTQVLLRNNGQPEIYQMLGSIYYDHGKFSRAIDFFKKALDVDPTYIEASVGLSILLNDLGRYKEGQEVFEKAQTVLLKKEKNADPFLKEQIAFKHEELGDLYFQNLMTMEALDEYNRAIKFLGDSPSLLMKASDAYLRLDQPAKAISELKKILRKDPAHIEARLKMGSIYYNSNSVTEAIGQWESVLLRVPHHQEAKKLLKEANLHHL